MGPGRWLGQVVNGPGIEGTDMADRRVFYDRAKKLANAIASIFEDAERWNATHPDEQPIDPDPDGLLRSIHASLGRFLRGEDR